MKTLSQALVLVMILAAFPHAARSEEGGNAAGGEEGFLLRGKRYVAYRDGKKVGPTLKETLDDEKKRAPAGAMPLQETPQEVIGFVQNDSHICFYITDLSRQQYKTLTGGHGVALSCMPRR